MNWLAEDMVERVARAFCVMRGREWTTLGPDQHAYYRRRARFFLSYLQEQP